MRVLVTGVYGFIGSCFARHVLSTTDHTVVGFGRDSDQLKKKRIVDFVDSPRFRLQHGDLIGNISGLVERIDAVVHFAAKTFVDHSIKDPSAFIQSNVLGTYNLLEQCRQYKPKKYIQISTDEVYGAILEGHYKEDARLNPTNPYAATKAAGDMLALAYYNTYGLNVSITRTENNYGPFQHPQKALPVFVRCALEGKPLPVYGDGQHKRMWLNVLDHCSAVLMLIERGEPGEIYHVAGEQELTNIDLARMVLRFCGKPEDRIELVPDWDIRPGHDRRYALDSSKIRALGWAPTFSLEAGMQEAVDWYWNHQWWFI